MFSDPNTKAQINIEHCNRCWRHSWDSASLPKSLRTNTIKFLLHFCREPWYIRKLELRWDAPSLRVFQPINLPLLLGDVPCILGLSLNSRNNAVQGLFIQVLSNPGGQGCNLGLRSPEPLQQGRPIIPGQFQC